MKKENGKWTPIELGLVYSDAFNSLTGQAVKILLYAKLQFKWEQAGRGKKFTRSYSPFTLPFITFRKKPFNMGPNTISKAITCLLERGFIEVVSQGGRCKGHTTTYKMSDKWIGWKEGDVIFKRKPFIKDGF